MFGFLCAALRVLCPPLRLAAYSNRKHRSDEAVSTTTRQRVGFLDWRLSISNCQLLLPKPPSGIRQLTIGNPMAHPLPRGGTDVVGTLVVLRAKDKCSD